MEGEPRKRKMDDDHNNKNNTGEGQRRREDKQYQQRKGGEGGKEDEEEEEAEEEKMEKFFALIRSTRDMRERMMRRSVASGEVQEKNDGQKKGAAAAGATHAMAWNPSFQPEDFLEAGPSSNRREEDGGDHQAGKGNGNDKGGTGLDLNLSL